MFFDPLYLVVIVVSGGLSLWASVRVRALAWLRACAYCVRDADLAFMMPWTQFFLWRGHSMEGSDADGRQVHTSHSDVRPASPTSSTDRSACASPRSLGDRYPCIRSTISRGTGPGRGSADRLFAEPHATCHVARNMPRSTQHAT